MFVFFTHLVLAIKYPSLGYVKQGEQKNPYDINKVPVNSRVFHPLQVFPLLYSSRDNINCCCPANNVQCMQSSGCEIKGPENRIGSKNMACFRMGVVVNPLCDFSGVFVTFDQQENASASGKSDWWTLWRTGSVRFPKPKNCGLRSYKRSGQRQARTPLPSACNADETRNLASLHYCGGSQLSRKLQRG